MKYGFVFAISDHTRHFVARTLKDVRLNGTHSKIDPLLDDMLRNYPKVDMGKAEKTAGN
jgi:hypothetical protein